MAMADFTPSAERAEPEALQREAKAQRARKIAEAMAFLRVAMAEGARPAAEVEAEGKAAGHAHSTLAEARTRLHIASKRQGHQWVWIPPRTRKKQPVG